MDADIEQFVKNFPQCELASHSPTLVQCLLWDYPQEQRRCLQWLDVAIVNSANTNTTVEKLRAVIATQCLPSAVVTGNGAVFTTKEFETFLHHNGMKPILSAPYHPSSTGQLERTVQLFKEGIKRARSGN
uniref:Integrase catalytic domain-containing protein n=1 Tax=Amphimedon queenslandica TaxID=400682 RepID=A0A1X7UB39_AMPQE